MSNSIHSDTYDTLRIGARRFDMSPFDDCYRGDDTIYGVVADRYYPVYTGAERDRCYWSLRNECVLYDVPEKPWQIEGPDALPFLEKLFARRIDTLEQGRGRYVIACTHDGGTFMDGILFRMAPDCYWFVQPDGALEPWLLAHSAGFDLRYFDPRGRVLQLQGPTSKQVMADLTNGAIDDSMRYFHAGFHDIGGQRLYVSRTGWTGELGYEIYTVETPSKLFDATDHRRLWNDLEAAGKPHGMVFDSMASMEIRRIEAGILDNITDFDVSMNPFQAGLGPFIDLDKTGFIGREALLEADRRVLLLGLRCAKAIPAYRGRVFDGDAEVARITAAAWSPTLDCGIGYVRFYEAGDWIGRTLGVQTVDGETTPCDIVPLPFFDPEKRLPRGLD